MKKLKDLFDKSQIVDSDKLAEIKGGLSGYSNKNDVGPSRSSDEGPSEHSDVGPSEYHDEGPSHGEDDEQ